VAWRKWHGGGGSWLSSLAANSLACWPSWRGHASAYNGGVMVWLAKWPIQCNGIS